MSNSVEESRPNILWILSEDNSHRFMRLFHPDGAETPNIERLADDGIVFTKAFSNAPVCSVARSTLVTGSYAPRLAAQFHRKIEPARLPESLPMFPACLGRSGYYRTNCAKKDYNLLETPGLWDESSRQATWRNRPSPNTPFFHQQNIGVCHESCLHYPAEEMHSKTADTDPDAVTIPEFHPDTPTFRYAYARYHDAMIEMDRQVGQIVDQLEADGLLEETFIFYFGDNGGILPGSKGYLWEDGLHVPLVVRIPAKFKHLCPLPRGSRSDAFVSFVDFGPTALNLAGVNVPPTMDGIPFLGASITQEDLAGKNKTFGYADRFDEKYELCRSIRVGRWKYIRNYQCFYPDGLQNNYRYLMAAYREWRELYADGELNPVTERFFTAKQPEALFNLETDPDELNDLAGEPEHADVLSEMRGQLKRWLRELPDLSLFPESLLLSEALGDPVRFGEERRAEISRLLDVADLALEPAEKAKAALMDSLNDESPWVRSWALTVCSCFADKVADLADFVRENIHDPVPLVRVRAAEFLAIIGAEDPRPVLYDVLKNSESAAEALITLNTAVFVNDHLPNFPIDSDRIELGISDAQLDRRLEYLNKP